MEVRPGDDKQLTLDITKCETPELTVCLVSRNTVGELRVLKTEVLKRRFVCHILTMLLPENLKKRESQGCLPQK